MTPPSKTTTRTMTWSLCVLTALGLCGCATTQLDTAPSPHPDRDAVWCVPAPVNNTSTPYAGERVQQQLAALLGARGLARLLVPPPANTGGPLPIDNGSDDQRQELDWARRHEVRYALLGSVDEWDYKIGLDGQPAVGFTVRLLDLQSGKVIWSGVASASGASREGLAALSERTLSGLVGRLLP